MQYRWNNTYPGKRISFLRQHVIAALKRQTPVLHKASPRWRHSVVRVPVKKEKRKHQLVICFIAKVWLSNEVVCKELKLVSQPSEIVARISGDEHTRMEATLISVLNPERQSRH
jgi:hypothetical protein